MTLDPNILLLKQWASDVTALVESPETHGITQAAGFDAAWDAGLALPRGLLNFNWRSWTATLLALLESGALLDWSDQLNYKAGAVVTGNVNRRTYRSTAVSGPDNGGAVDPETAGQTTWEELGAGVIENASESTAGVGERATQTEFDDGTAAGDTGAPLFVDPGRLVARRADSAIARAGTDAAYFLMASAVGFLRASLATQRTGTNTQQWVTPEGLHDVVDTAASTVTAAVDAAQTAVDADLQDVRDDVGDAESAATTALNTAAQNVADEIEDELQARVGDVNLQGELWGIITGNSSDADNQFTYASDPIQIGTDAIQGISGYVFTAGGVYSGHRGPAWGPFSGTNRQYAGVRLDWYQSSVLTGSAIVAKAIDASTFYTSATTVHAFRTDMLAFMILSATGVMASGGSRELRSVQNTSSGGALDSALLYFPIANGTITSDDTLQVYLLTLPELLSVAYLPAVAGERIAEVALATSGNSVNSVGLGTWSTPAGVSLPGGFNQANAYLGLPAARPATWTGLHIEVRVDTANVADRFLPWGELFAASSDGIVFRAGATNYEVIPVVYYSGDNLRLGLAAGQSTFPADTVINVRGGGVFT